MRTATVGLRTRFSNPLGMTSGQRIWTTMTLTKTTSTYTSRKLEEPGQNSNLQSNLKLVRPLTCLICRERKSSFYRQSGITNLQRSLTDLFGAGSETSSSVLLFTLLYMIKYPEIQAKVHTEIDQTLGGENR